MRQNSDIMRVIAAGAREDNEMIGKLTEKAQRDSRAVKVLTYVALMYLPAQLVAVSYFLVLFVSFLDLVQIQGKRAWNDTDNNKKFDRRYSAQTSWRWMQSRNTTYQQHSSGFIQPLQPLWWLLRWS